MDQVGLRLALCGDVTEHDDRAEQPPFLLDRSAGVLDGKAGAVLPPEHFIQHPVHAAIAKGGVDRTRLDGISGAVLVAMVHVGVGDAADQFFRAPPQHALGSRVEKRGSAFGVDAVDALAGGVKDQLVAPFELPEDGIDAVLLRQAASIELVEFRFRPPRAHGSQIVSDQQDEFACAHLENGCE